MPVDVVDFRGQYVNHRVSEALLANNQIQHTLGHIERPAKDTDVEKASKDFDVVYDNDLGIFFGVNLFEEDQ